MKANTFENLEILCKEKKQTVWEYTQEETSCLCEYTKEEVRETVKLHIEAMKDAIKNGMKSEEKSISNWCGDDCKKLITQYNNTHSLFGKLFEKILIYALATSEENLRMGKIVACPTAGSCGIVPSVLIAYAEEYNISLDEQINALITAGKIGEIISNKIQLAGAVAGCQAECGVAAGMCAGALTQMRKGNISQILNSVALSLKNTLGLTCDSVCGLVEVPCIKRNPILAIQAVTASEMALAGIDSKIPLDEVVDAMCQTGQLMSPLLKESAQAGLATTQTGLKLKEQLFD